MPPATKLWHWPTMSLCWLNWFRHDILTVAGPSYTDRCELYDFVVAELKARARNAPIGWSRSAALCRINAMTYSPSHAGSMRIWSN